MKKKDKGNTLGIVLSEKVYFRAPNAEAKYSQNMFDLFMKLLLILMGAFGVLSCLNDGFTISFSFFLTSLELVVPCIYFFSLNFVPKQVNSIMKIMGAAVFVVALIVFREPMADSIVYLYTCVAKNYNTYYGVELSVFDVENRDAGGALVLLLLPVCGLLSGAAQKKGFFGRVLPALMTYPLLAIFCGHMPGTFSLILCVMSFLGLYIMRQTAVCHSAKVCPDNALKSGVYGMAAFLMLTLFGLSAYMGYGLFYPKIEETVAPVRYAVYNSSMRELFAQLRNRTSVGGINGGQLNGRTSLSFDYSTHLVVKTDTDVDTYTYLKGYVGVNYEKNSWSGLDEEVYASDSYQALLAYDEDDIISLTYNILQYSDKYYLDSAFSDFSAVRWYVTVPDESVNDSEYLCFPYAGLASSSDGDINDYAWLSRRYEDGLENVYDSYTFSLSDVYSSAQSDAEDMISYWTATYDGYFAEDLMETIELESTYRSFVYENYLEVPDSVSRLYEEYSAYAGKFDSLDSAVKFVQDEVSDNAVYTLSPNPIPYGEDFIEYFMYESKQGYCVYFASAAVMIFRSMGIPARYVEGYLIPPTTADSEVVIEDSNAHAWVEIYVDGFGWLPVEVTPGYTGESAGFTPEMNSEDSVAEANGETVTLNENETVDSSEENEESEDESEDDTESEAEPSTEEPVGQSDEGESGESIDESGEQAMAEGESGVNSSSSGDESGSRETEEGDESAGVHSGDSSGSGTAEGEEALGSDASGGETVSDGESQKQGGFSLSGEAINAIRNVFIVLLVIVVIIGLLFIHRRAVITSRRRRINQKNGRLTVLSLYAELCRMSKRYYVAVDDDANLEELSESYDLELADLEQFFEIVKEAAFSDHEIEKEKKDLALSVYYKCVRNAYGKLKVIKKTVFTVWDGYR